MNTQVEAVSQTQQPALPEFPKLSGPLGRLVDAITPDIPYEFRAVAALTQMGVVLSGRTQLAGGDYHNLQPRFYACLIGSPSSGKSAAVKEVKHALNDLGGVHVEGSINSERQLIEALNENPRLLYSPDEAIVAFDKAKQSGLRGKILELLEGNYVKYRVKGNKFIEVHDAHFALIATATPDVFSQMWTGLGGSSGGLQSRFILAYSEQRMPRVKTGSETFSIQVAVDELTEMLKDLPEFIELPPTKGDFTRGLEEGLDTDELSRDELARVEDMARRFSLIMAACNGKQQIDSEIIQLGNAFLRYEMAALDKLMPRDSWTWTQRFENSILKFFERRQAKMKPGEVFVSSERDVQTAVTPGRVPGGFGVFKNAFNNLVNAKEIDKSGQTNRSGYPLWKLHPERDPSRPVPAPWMSPQPPKANQNPDPTPTVHTVDAKDSGPAIEAATVPTPTVPTVEEGTDSDPVVVEVKTDPGPTVPTPVVESRIMVAVHPVTEWLSKEQVDKLQAEISRAVDEYGASTSGWEIRSAYRFFYSTLECTFSKPSDESQFKSWLSSHAETYGEKAVEVLGRNGKPTKWNVNY